MFSTSWMYINYNLGIAICGFEYIIFDIFGILLVLCNQLSETSIIYDVLADRTFREIPFGLYFHSIFVVRMVGYIDRAIGA